jgi:hypothetical protein
MGVKSQSNGDERLCLGGGLDNHQLPPIKDVVEG